MTTDDPGPRQLQFVRMYAEAPEIVKATANGAEQIPLRARRGCGPLNVASGMGWTIFPPVDFDLMWDGDQIYCQLSGMEEWIKVDRMFLPGHRDVFEAEAPDFAESCAPIFLEAFPEPGVVQIWTGYAIVTPKGWSAWMRAPINQPLSGLYETYDGIIETDWWYGGMIVNIRIRKTDIPIGFRSHLPLATIVPVPQDFVAQDRQWRAETVETAEAAPQFWDRLVENAERRNSEPVGSYNRCQRARGSTS